MYGVGVVRMSAHVTEAGRGRQLPGAGVTGGCEPEPDIRSRRRELTSDPPQALYQQVALGYRLNSSTFLINWLIETLLLIPFLKYFVIICVCVCICTHMCTRVCRHTCTTVHR